MWCEAVCVCVWARVWQSFIHLYVLVCACHEMLHVMYMYVKYMSVCDCVQLSSGVKLF